MITARDTEEALMRLATQRPLFHSEADFQHALAWSVHKSNPNTVVRLELPFRTDTSSEYLDLQFANGSQSFAVELKYKTRLLMHKHAGESFSLKRQNAQDNGRYDFLADVERLERFVAEGHASAGCAILLTNDPSYWSLPTRSGTADEAFRLNEGRVIHGSLAWLTPPAVRTREKPITLKGEYSAIWKPYSKLCGDDPGGEFRFLALHIK